MQVTETDAPKRVLYCITKANWGGAQRYVYDMALAAREAGYEVAVAYGSPGRLADRLQEAGIQIFTVTSMSRDVALFNDISAYFELVKIIKLFKPQIVHSNSSKAGVLASLAARMAGARLSIFTAHGWAFNEARPNWQRAFIALSHYGTVLLSNQTICVSEAMKRDAHWMPFVRRRLHVIHNGIDKISFLPRDEARIKLVPFIATSFWIGTIAELHPTKQLNTAIEAFAKIAQEFPQAMLVVMGEGQERLYLEKLIEQYDLGERVYLCGFVENAPAYLKTLDVFFLSSRSEALAYAVLEAGEAMLPVIASRVGGLPEIITNDSYGVLVKSGDSDELSRAFSDLISHTERRTKLGEALYTKVAHDFSIETMATKTIAIYASKI